MIWSGEEGVAVFLDVVPPVEVVPPAEGLKGFVDGVVVLVWQRSPIVSVQPTVGFAPRSTWVRPEIGSYSIFFVDFGAART
jgi:hypothetical protein